MGYRNYLGSLPKKEYNKIKRMTLKELYEYKGEEWSDDPYNKPGYVGVYDVAYNRHYELGKYVNQFPKKYFKTVFKNKETQKHFTEEHEFYVVEKEFVKLLIEHYTEKIRKYYKEMLEPFFDDDKSKAEFMKTKDTPMTEKEIAGVYSMIDHVRSMAMDWGVSSWFKDMVPYNLDDPKKDFITSWKYEYSIFNLVILYHTFDWKRNVMIYYGY